MQYDLDPKRRGHAAKRFPRGLLYALFLPEVEAFQYRIPLERLGQALRSAEAQLTQREAQGGQRRVRHQARCDLKCEQ